MSLIRCITGSESFSAGSASLIVTAVPTTDFAFPDNGIFIGEAAKQGRYIATPNRPVYLPASNNGVTEQGCYWDGTFMVPDGVVLRVFAKRRERIAAGRATDYSGVVFIRAREDAALYRLTLQRIVHTQSTGADVLVEGRFDVLSLREAGAAGVPLTNADLTLSRNGRAQSVLRAEVLQAARRERGKVKIEKMTDHEGAVVNVMTTRSRRATNIG